MFVEFSVSNFRSIKTRQTLSMVAGSSAAVRKTKSFATALKTIPYLLRSAAIYGANGSGKTSIIKAVDFFKSFVLGSAREREPASKIENLTPYLFSASTRDSPTEFEITFIVDSKIYQYGFRIDQERVWSEWLFLTSKGVRPIVLLDRTYHGEIDEYDVNIHPSISGAKSAWKASTRKDALLLSTAVSLNSDDLKIPYDWIRKSLKIIKSSDRISPDFTANLYTKTDSNLVKGFIQDVGVDINSLHIEEIDLPNLEELDIFKSEFIKYAKETLTKPKKVLCEHIDEDGSPVLLPFSEESDGTRALIALAGPWIDVSQRGITLFVDELHNSLHPLALRYLLENYFTSKVGDRGGQLVFTTHDIFPMDEVSLHRDQIWFVEKPAVGGSKLIPLSDYNIRSGETYRLGYIKGRYGGVPRIKFRGTAQT